MIISRLTNDVQALDQLVSDGIVTLFGSSLTLIGTAVILVVLDWQLALMTFLVFPVLGIGSVAFRIVSADAYRATREKVAQITAYLQETLSGVRVVRIFAQEQRHEARLRAAQRREPRGEHEDGQPQRGVLPRGRAAVGARDRGDPALRRAAGDRGRRDGRRARRVHRGAEQLLRPDPAALAALHDLPGRHGGARQDLRAARRGARAARPARTRSSCRGCAASCEFEDVTFAYSPDGEPALEGIDLHVPAGQTVALVGSTGAGKSTFAKLAARFYDPTEGRILVDGHDLRDVRARSLRAQMGIVPQEAFLFSGTIRDNLAFGRADATDAEIEAAARAVGAHDFIAGARARLRHRGRRARDPALGRPAPARRVHARADRRPADPRARRGDVERRHPHREPDRGRACGGCSPAAPRS